VASRLGLATKILINEQNGESVKAEKNPAQIFEKLKVIINELENNN
tara:strand:+ start:24 stop:161 length:138 start_codon:yes stop_codon:yes gene_type:complete